MEKLFLAFCFLAAIFCNAQNKLNTTVIEQLIEKEVALKNDSLSNALEEKVKIFTKFQTSLQDKNYETAISLFTIKYRKFIRDIQKDKESFNLWIQAWTLDKIRFEHFIAKMRTGKMMVIFKYEDDEWRIDEK